MRKNRVWLTLVAIGIITGIAIVMCLPNVPKLNLKPIGIDYEGEIKIRQGLDLQGGAHLTYEADMSKVEPKDRDNALSGVVDVIERRINPGGVSEIVIQSAKSGDSYRVIVEMPGVKDLNAALDLIGKTAQLDFKELDAKGQWVSIGLTGKDFKRADAQINPQTGAPEISIEFTASGTKLFAAATKRNLQKPIAIYLDDQLLSAPTVESEIVTGKGVITGKFTVEEARTLAVQLNAGALPVPVKLIEQRTVGATLGKDSIQKSLIAGSLGLLVVAIFMLFYYRFAGLLATFALIIYSLISLAVFKNPFIPITLTLAGVAGFILSIGMAVDANILIFERMKEELRQGKSLSSSIEIGFKRAWSSIRDSNASSLITCAILFWFGSGLVRGFAVTLAIGILISMFTAISISRTFLRVAEKIKFLQNTWLYGVRRKK